MMNLKIIKDRFLDRVISVPTNRINKSACIPAETYSQLLASIGSEAKSVALKPFGVVLSTDVQSGFEEIVPMFVLKAGDKMTGNLDMGSNKVQSSGVPSDLSDLCNKQYVDSAVAGIKNNTTSGGAAYIPITGGIVSGDLNMQSNKITSQAVPTSQQDLCNKAYVDANVSFNSVNVASVSINSSQQNKSITFVPGAGIQITPNQSQNSLMFQLDNTTILSASTTTRGIVKLVDDLTSTSSVDALTAKQGYLLNNKISQLLGVLNFAGVYNANTNILDKLSVHASSKGLYSVGRKLPNAGAITECDFFIVSNSGTGVVPAPATYIKTGDWIVSTDSAWVVIPFSIYKVVANDVLFDSTYQGSVITASNLQDAVADLDVTRIVNPAIKSAGQQLIFNGTKWIAQTPSQVLQAPITISNSTNSESLILRNSGDLSTYITALSNNGTVYETLFSLGRISQNNKDCSLVSGVSNLILSAPSNYSIQCFNGLNKVLSIGDTITCFKTFDSGSHKITTTYAPLNPEDLCNKLYVDSKSLALNLLVNNSAITSSVVNPIKFVGGNGIQLTMNPTTNTLTFQGDNSILSSAATVASKVVFDCSYPGAKIRDTNLQTAIADLDLHRIVDPGGTTAGQLLVFDGSNWGAQMPSTNLNGPITINQSNSYEILTLKNPSDTPTYLKAYYSSGGSFHDLFTLGRIFTGDKDCYLDANAGDLFLRAPAAHKVNICFDGNKIMSVGASVSCFSSLDLGSNKATSTYAPINNNDIVNKLYVDSALNNLLIQSRSMQANTTAGVWYKLMQWTGSLDAEVLISSLTSGFCESVKINILGSLEQMTSFVQTAGYFDTFSDLAIINTGGFANSGMQYLCVKVVGNNLTKVQVNYKFGVTGAAFQGGTNSMSLLSNTDGSFVVCTAPSNSFAIVRNSFYLNGVQYLSSANMLNKTGDTMTGILNMGSNAITCSRAPTGINDLCNKQYVDFQVIQQVSVSGDTMTGNLNMGSNRVYSSATPSQPNDLCNKQYTDNLVSTSLSSLGSYVSKTGDIMTGMLSMGTNVVRSTAVPSTTSDLCNKAYVDASTGGLLRITGGTLTGNLNMGTNMVRCTNFPALGQDLCNKAYVDQGIATVGTRVSKEGDVMTGALDLGVNKVTTRYTPVNPNDLCNKAYVDQAVLNINVLGLVAQKVSKNGDFMSGMLDMGSNPVLSSYLPVNPQDLCNKTYVDNFMTNSLSSVINMVSNTIGLVVSIIEVNVVSGTWYKILSWTGAMNINILISSYTPGGCGILNLDINANLDFVTTNMATSGYQTVISDMAINTVGGTGNGGAQFLWIRIANNISQVKIQVTGKNGKNTTAQLQGSVSAYNLLYSGSNLIADPVAPAHPIPVVNNAFYLNGVKITASYNPLLYNGGLVNFGGELAVTSKFSALQDAIITGATTCNSTLRVVGLSSLVGGVSISDTMIDTGGNILAGNNRLATTYVPVNSDDLCNKAYVDGRFDELFAPVYYDIYLSSWWVSYNTNPTNIGLRGPIATMRGSLHVNHDLYYGLDFFSINGRVAPTAGARVCCFNAELSIQNGSTSVVFSSNTGGNWITYFVAGYNLWLSGGSYMVV